MSQHTHTHDSRKLHVTAFDGLYCSMFCDIKSKLWLVSYQHTKTCVSNLELNFVQLPCLHHNSKERRLQKNDLHYGTGMKAY